jgi:hypothetical protein
MRIAITPRKHKLPEDDSHAHDWAQSRDRRKEGYTFCRVDGCGAFQACEAAAEDATVCHAYAGHPGVHRGTNPAGIPISWGGRDPAEMAQLDEHRAAQAARKAAAAAALAGKPDPAP